MYRQKKNKKNCTFWSLVSFHHQLSAVKPWTKPVNARSVKIIFISRLNDSAVKLYDTCNKKKNLYTNCNSPFPLIRSFLERKSIHNDIRRHHEFSTKYDIKSWRVTFCLFTFNTNFRIYHSQTHTSTDEFLLGLLYRDVSHLPSFFLLSAILAHLKHPFFSFTCLFFSTIFTNLLRNLTLKMFFLMWNILIDFCTLVSS